ncbi:hypothetical protein [Aquipuribacter sp. SD81]|uniref:hypothetical protein n=1 Tax=Aquipuribacter sp. SD81 TaxID=3127703 RepID=UPI003019E2DE
MGRPDGGDAATAPWHAAADEAARTITADRGVSDPCSVTEEDGRLVVRYGSARVPLGPDGDVADPAALHAALDRWVAWEREDGPGRWLPRDDADLHERRRLVEESVAAYREAASLLAADLARTLGEMTVWTVVPAEHVTERPDAPQPGRPPVPTIQVAVETLGGSGVLGVEPLADPALGPAAVALLAASADHLGEIVHGRWPTCPDHGTQLAPVAAAGRVSWVCADGGHVVAELGRLREDDVVPTGAASDPGGPAG